MIIKGLDYKKYKGKKYQAKILSDRYAYSNRGPEEHNMRLEMGKML